MANFVDKIKVATGVQNKNHFDLSCSHFTTSAYFRPNITYMHEMVPGESITVDMRQFTRLAPMIKPMMGEVKIHNRLFFVPMRTLLPHWNEFITNTKVYNCIASQEINPTIPVITEAEIRAMFFNTSFGLTEVLPQTAETYDFAYRTGSTGLGTFYRYTAPGRLYLKLLQQLGYNIDMANGGRDFTYSALPLMAYVKIWYDWYRNTTWYPHLEEIETLFSEEVEDSYAINGALLYRLLNLVVRIPLDRDVFTTASLKPLGQNADDNTNFTITDNTISTGTTAVAQQDGTPNINLSTPGGVGRISEYILNVVKRYTDWAVRHNIAGSQAFTRMLADYGVTMNSVETRRSEYIGNNITDVDIADVTSTSYGDDTLLGELGAKGVGASKNTWKYSTNEFGYLMVVTTVIPRYSYYQGIDPAVTALEFNDFFNPSFDGLGVEAIPYSELKNDYTSVDRLNIYPQKNKVFGFTSRYHRYKCVPQDKVTGDFRINSRKENMSGWLITREISDDNIFTTTSAAFSDSQSAQFSDIFATSNQEDNFVIANYFKVDANLPMKKMFDNYEFDDEHDREVTMPVNGVQMQ